jgi:thermitase
MKRFIVFTLTFTLALAFLPAMDLIKVETRQLDQISPKYVPGELIVKYKSGIANLQKQTVRNRVFAEQMMTLRTDDDGDGMELVKLADFMGVDETISYLKEDPRVDYAEPNWIYNHFATSNDPFYTNGSLWGIYGDATTPANQFGSQAGEAWAAGNTGSDAVYIGVIDEGIDFNHPDLAANIWTNPFDPLDGIDNDGNGRIDDIHGWDFAANNNSIYDGTSDDHGTHVAGTIGAVGGNGIGVAGVNWNVTIISAKFLGASGGTTANAINAVNYITDLKTRHGLNIVATSNSWGGGGFSQALLDAITRGVNAGILFVAAAGNSNSNNNTTPNYPSNYNTTMGSPASSFDGVIAVASITSSGAKSSFSSYGSTTVDLGAPGSGIFSTTPNNTYSSYSGTSMATPHVSGAVALYRSVFPGATAYQTKAAILNSASNTPTSSLSGITVTGGRLNLGFLLGGGGPQPNPPAAPSGLSASAVSSSQINLNWSDNSNNESGFQIERCQGADCSNFALVATTGSNATSFSNTGLAASTTYTYRVRATNSAGNSGYSNTASATTTAGAAVPAAPSNLRVTTVGQTSIGLAWNDNSNNETRFEFFRRTGSSTTFVFIGSVGANRTSATNINLSRFTTYTYRMRACNGNGCSAYSNTATGTTN